MISKGDKKYNQELLDLAAIPSISSLPEHAADVEKAAKWLIKKLNSAGFEVMSTIPFQDTLTYLPTLQTS